MSAIAVISHPQQSCLNPPSHLVTQHARSFSLTRSLPRLEALRLRSTFSMYVGFQHVKLLHVEPRSLLEGGHTIATAGQLPGSFYLSIETSRQIRDTDDFDKCHEITKHAICLLKKRANARVRGSRRQQRPSCELTAPKVVP